LIAGGPWFFGTKAHVGANLETGVAHSLVTTLVDELEHVKARIRAKGEHAVRVIKRQFGFTKVGYRGLARNTAKLHTLFVLGNL
jgi:IS5 family transposase